MIERKEAREIKTCCATFYQSDIVRLLLGDVLHPGGLELTGYLGTVTGLGSEDKVLDIACGRGASAVYLAKRFGCHVTGLDYGQDNILSAQNHASLEKVSHLTTFRKGDADTVMSPDSYQAAIYAAGGAIRASEAVMNGEVGSAFALVRPPGHHATSQRAMGFCLFNNVAIAAKYALAKYKLDRIIIID